MKFFAKSFLFLGLIPAILFCAISRETRVKTPDEIEPADTIKYVDNGNIFEYEMVEEIDLGEGVIKVWFGKNGEYPLLVIYDRKFRKYDFVWFYTADSNKTIEIEKGGFRISPNAEYTGMTKVVEDSAENEPTKMKFVLLDKDGNEIWGKEYPMGYESGGATHYVSDKGAVAEHSGKTLTFYDSKGTKVKEVELLYARPETGINSGFFSEDGNYLVANLMDNEEKEIFSSGTGVILFNNLGEELWRFETEEANAGRLYISSEGEYIIAASHNWGRDEEGMHGLIKRITYLLDREGHLIRKYSNLMSSPGNFSSSGNYAIVCDTKERTAYLLDTKTGIRLFELKRGFSVHNACIAESAKLIGITYDNKVELIQFNGIKAWSHEIPNPRYIWVSDDGSKITVRSDEKKTLRLSDGKKITVSGNNKILRFEKVK